jgi:hypothetical protein
VREHDESKLPKWVQARLERARTGFRLAHETLMRGDANEMRYYKVSHEMQERIDAEMYRSFENAMWGMTPANPGESGNK